MSNQVFFPLSQAAIDAGVTVEQVGDRINSLIRNHVLQNVNGVVSQVQELATQTDNYDLQEQVMDLFVLEEYTDECYEQAASDANFNELGDYDSWQDLCECEVLDVFPERSEVYEHWSVDNYLAELLEDHGQVVDNDFLGLAVWGRCTTGQHMSLDYVFHKIAEQVEIDMAKYRK